jgi:hypothetical protein
VANDKERLGLLKHWIAKHPCYKETEGYAERQIIDKRMERRTDRTVS